MSGRKDGHRVTLADRRAAWPFRPEGYGPSDRSDWMSGKLDANAAIQAFYHHRLDSLQSFNTAQAPKTALDEARNLAGDVIAEATLKRGMDYPYDAPDDWTFDDGPPPATDWAHAAARGVIADLCDRGGIKHGFNNIDEEIRVEIVGSLAAIIRVAPETPLSTPLPSGSIER